MTSEEFQNWIQTYYEERGWHDLDIFIRIGFLSEETGEVARAIRALEIGRDRPEEERGDYQQNKVALTEELGDVLGNIAVIANKYNISLEDVFTLHRNKLEERYAEKG
ncbi:MazG nucleotide pyrophosphohydrolase domain-containing protein [Shouchella lehensis]|uniref:Pyrophosphohydrolase n=1 Tax=Shouchella lehensis G1 TaxID=1246626 RepID=A0A060LSJ9_9BACI|nr:MazG-like family protein [Shouchella lehensis]AIC93097.1 pyrophosphohydrolase [Shouchella lehensis G1]